MEMSKEKLKEITFEAFSLWRDSHNIKAHKNKFNKWFNEKLEDRG